MGFIHPAPAFNHHCARFNDVEREAVIFLLVNLEPCGWTRGREQRA